MVILHTHTQVWEAMMWKVQLTGSDKSNSILLESITNVLWKRFKAICSLVLSLLGIDVS